MKRSQAENTKHENDSTWKLQLIITTVNTFFADHDIGTD